MLTLYRRHTLACGRADRYWKRCQCPMWVEGTLDRRYMRKSMHTQSWERAKGIVENWEKTGAPAARQDVPTWDESIEAYLAECRDDRDLSEKTVLNYAYALGRFRRWADRSNYVNVAEIDQQALKEYLSIQKWVSSTKLTERRGLRQFFRYCVREKWIIADPTADLPVIKLRQAPTQPLDRQQFAALLEVIDDARTRAIVLVLRYSGLRIGDALRLERTRVQAELLALRQQKTGDYVSVLLPPVVLEALDALPTAGSRYFIPDGPQPAQAMTSHANRARLDIARFANRAGIGHVHPHQLRDTFAVELLLAGVPLDLVSKLLGHSSVNTTEKHYSPWVKARQEQLNAAVRLAWGPPAPPG